MSHTGQHVLTLHQAFESPLLANEDSNSSGRDIARSVDDRPIRYGARSDFSMHGRTKLAFADPSVVLKPESGAKFAC